MYVHAYQSLIWNSTVSAKIARHGFQPRVGDLVAKQPGAEKIEKKDVLVLTEENISDYDIYDVVLPLVGHDVVWPENETKDWMEEAFTRGDEATIVLASRINRLVIHMKYGFFCFPPPSPSVCVHRRPDPR